MGPMGRPALIGYPVNLLVAGRRCVVVGAGRIAARKIAALLDAGAAVHVVAPELGPEVRDWQASGALTVDERTFVPTDLDRAWLATSATPDSPMAPAAAILDALACLWLPAAWANPASTEEAPASPPRNR